MSEDQVVGCIIRTKNLEATIDAVATGSSTARVLAQLPKASSAVTRPANSSTRTGAHQVKGKNKKTSKGNPVKVVVKRNQNSVKVGSKGKTNTPGSGAPIVNKPVNFKTKLANKNQSKGTETVTRAQNLEASIDAVATGRNPSRGLAQLPEVSSAVTRPANSSTRTGAHQVKGENGNTSKGNPVKALVKRNQNSVKLSSKGKIITPGPGAPIVNRPVNFKTKLANKNQSKGTESLTRAQNLEASIDAVATGSNLNSASTSSGNAGTSFVVTKRSVGGALKRTKPGTTGKTWRTKKTKLETVTRALSPDIVENGWKWKAKASMSKIGTKIIGIHGNTIVQGIPSSCISGNGLNDDVNGNIAIIAQACQPTDQPARRASLEVVTTNLEILLTFETCSCLFCGEKLEVGQGIVLQNCCCSFCKNCLIPVVENSSSVDIFCPLECGSRMLEREIKAIVPPETYERYRKRTENKIKVMVGNVFFCRTKDCRGCCEYQPDSKIFLCTDCNKRNCMSCKAIHEGLECKEFQDLLAIAIRDGKSKEEAESFINPQVANRWEQILGTVSGRMVKRYSEDYAKSVQEMENLDIWVSTREFECPVCTSTIPVGDGIVLQDCLHTLCRECAIGLVEYATEPVVKCPFQDGNYSCTSHLKPREIKALVSPELHEAFLARSVKQAEGTMSNSFHCKTPDCDSWCEFEQGAKVFKCYICSKTNCLACEAIHENVSCEDYKNKLVQNTNDETSKKMLEELIAKGECMLCPTCKIVTEKTEGCDWLVCLVCKTEICWATKGPRWGPKGQGDVSGGCKCKWGDKLCVPHCKNCH